MYTLRTICEKSKKYIILKKVGVKTQKKIFFSIFDIGVISNVLLFAEHDSGYQNCLERKDLEKSGRWIIKKYFENPLKHVFFGSFAAFFPKFSNFLAHIGSGILKSNSNFAFAGTSKTPRKFNFPLEIRLYSFFLNGIHILLFSYTYSKILKNLIYDKFVKNTFEFWRIVLLKWDYIHFSKYSKS